MSKLQSKYYIQDDTRDSSNDDDSNASDQADGDVIRCICDDTSDDGFTIQCEKCEDWQHASCVNIKKSNIPDHYICERCTKKLKQPLNDRRQNELKGNTHSHKAKLNMMVDKKKKTKKVLKRSNNTKKRLYPDDSDENEEEQYLPPQISKKKFTHLAKSVFKEKLVEDLLIEVHRQWIELNRPKSAGKSNAESSKAAPSKGLESIVVMESNLLLPAIPKASVKPLRKSLRGSYLQHQKDPSVEKGVFADIHIPEHRYLMEVTGELIRKSKYKNDTENNFSLLGTPLAHVFFYRSIDICIDARYAGNDTRYIRRSCSPNSEIKSIILPNDNDDQTIHMGIYTSEEIDRGEEITIGWNWHRGLLMWHKNKEFLRKNHKVDIDASERKNLKKALKLLAQEFGECACEDKDECLIENLKEELEKGDDKQDGDAQSVTPSNKKKRLLNTGKSRVNSPEVIKKPEPSVVKKPVARVKDIFTSDEEEEEEEEEEDTTKRDNKQIQYIKNNTITKSKSTPIPSSPAVSVTESIDIDIISMSPIPSQNMSENESDTHIGNKRIRPLSNSDLKLPCKKKWLREYMFQQQQLKAKAAQPSPQTEKIEPDIKSIAQDIDPEAELSDVASSESTLPLEDTPTTSDNEPTEMNQEVSLEGDTAVKVESQDKDTEVDIKTELNETTTLVSEHEEQKLSFDQPESSTSSSKIDEAKQAPRKLTLQEYLSLRRGNLPTPDDKPPVE